jgi:hypothetical protein
MSEYQPEREPLEELLEIARAAETLAKDEEAFKEAAEAFLARDASRFEAALERVGLADHCRHICFFFCEKHCVGQCLRFCPGRPRRPLDAGEIREFALALANVDARTLERLIDLVEKDNVDAWNELLTQRELTKFCHQLCHFLCRVRCRRICRELCPRRPLITRVSSIPVSQIGPQGFGNGPSIPPFQVPAPNPPAGVGDHPVGASVWLMGVFNMPTATQYKVEIADNPAGPYSPLAEPVTGYNENPFPPPANGPPVTRFPSGGADPGWYEVADIPDSDGGPTALGEKTLLYWTSTTVADGIYYLRLRVRDGVVERVSSPQVVQTDNTAPPTPVISLQLLKEDGSKTPLKCGEVKQGDGLILVTVQAFDPNFSRLSVAAQGNSSLSVPIVGVPAPLFPGGAAVPLSKTYNGVLADQGYPVATEFVWDPWSDPAIVENPCCYVVRIDIWDRAVLNNAWSGGHGNSGWEAIEISL